MLCFILVEVYNRLIVVAFYTCRSREGLSFIEDLQKKKGEQLQEDMDEYEAARKEEKQKEADEIAELKRKRVRAPDPEVKKLTNILTLI